jgi:REP element-mobilizing transposase RayT
MELLKRKPTRLKGYDYSQNGAYYVTICTHKRERLFGEIVGATLRGRPNEPHRMIEKWLNELENKYNGVKLDKYIIMPDHIHFILFLDGNQNHAPLPVIIDWFKTMTTNDYIKGVNAGLYPRYNQHLWQRNYYEHVIRNDADLNDIRAYIDANPVQWEIRNL